MSKTGQPVPTMGWPMFTMAAGPTEVSPYVLAATGQKVLHHYDPAFMKYFEDTTKKYQEILKTKNDVVLVQGDAVLALEAAAYGLIAPGDKCINVVSGYFGKGYEGWIDAYGGKTIEVGVEYNEAVSVEAVEKALNENPDVKVLAMVQSETPSGTLNPGKEICQLAHERGVITIVDSVSGVASTDVNVDEWKTDVLVTGSQKCIGAPPGLSIVSVSDRAWDKMKKKNPPRWSEMCLLDWKEMWIDTGCGGYPCTPSVSLVYGISAAADELLAEGVDNAIARHAQVAKAYRAGLKAMGLELWAASEDIAANACTTFKCPEGIDTLKFRYHLREKYGVFLAAGLRDHAKIILRIGHMAYTAKPIMVPAVLGMIGKTFEDFGKKYDTTAGVAAALELL